MAKYRITEQCIGCGECLAVCELRCIRPGIPFAIIRDKCDDCGRCYKACLAGVIEMQKITKNDLW